MAQQYTVEVMGRQPAVFFTGSAETIVTLMRLDSNEIRERTGGRILPAFATDAEYIHQMIAVVALVTHAMPAGYPSAHDRSALAFLDYLQRVGAIRLTQVNPVAEAVAGEASIDAIIQQEGL